MMNGNEDWAFMRWGFPHILGETSESRRSWTSPAAAQRPMTTHKRQTNVRRTLTKQKRITMLGRMQAHKAVK